MDTNLSAFVSVSLGFARAFVEPVLFVIHAVPALHFQIAGVRACDGFFG